MASVQSSENKEQETLLAMLLQENEHIRLENELLAYRGGRGGSSGRGAWGGPGGGGGGDDGDDDGDEDEDEDDGGSGGGGGHDHDHLIASPSAQRREADAPPVVDSLSIEEKGELLGHAQEAIEAALETVRQVGEKDLSDIATLMEEVDLRIGELKKSTLEFKRDVVLVDRLTAANNLGAKAGNDADSVLRFMERSIAGKEALVEKFRLKNGTLVASMAKLEAQLSREEGMGEALRQVDFEQLKIENQQHQETLQARNQELLRMKKTAADTAQALNDAKALLAALDQERQGLRREILQRTTELQSLERAQAKTSGEVLAARRFVASALEAQSTIDAPSSMDYIRLKHEVLELQKQKTDWERKIEIRMM